MANPSFDLKRKYLVAKSSDIEKAKADMEEQYEKFRQTYHEKIRFAQSHVIFVDGLFVFVEAISYEANDSVTKPLEKSSLKCYRCGTIGYMTHNCPNCNKKKEGTL